MTDKDDGETNVITRILREFCLNSGEPLGKGPNVERKSLLIRREKVFRNMYATSPFT